MGRLREEFFHLLWKHQLFDASNLQTTCGKSIEVLFPGELHQDSGPDFSSARLRIDGLEWVGNVELHMRAQEWYQHKHQLDSAYDNVILHVVWYNSSVPCYNSKGELSPTLVLESKIKEDTIQNYQYLMGSLKLLPCEQFWNHHNAAFILQELDAFALDRLALKAKDVLQNRSLEKSAWSQLVFEVVMKQFGFHVNANPMLQLARSIPVKIVQQNINQVELLEALFFGQAGLLYPTKYIHAYHHSLVQHYSFLKKKYDLKPMDASAWKRSRMRPANFPTLRIAQAVGFWVAQPDFFSQCLNIDLKQVNDLSWSVEASEFWQQHLDFECQDIKTHSKLGKFSMQQIALNVLPLLWYIYGKNNFNEKYVNLGLQLLKMQRFEENRYTKVYQKYPIQFHNALQSQALRHLWEQYCSRKNCLNCRMARNWITGTQPLESKIMEA